ncbi:lipid droplet-associated hydrolase [Zootoca vivipara]|uniref:lipid droplet-associated hydrolase n=1 Tax=Zootoca vivipara TaxID=8524 RepID=UPI00293BFF24|nr:lipid droplet-associated hydrolase [Zootoca vivipara]XP_060128422.1 lipid droplet-associated hydrolase [Zootoca vivipara]
MKSEPEVPLHEEFTYVYGLATQVIKCGPWKDLWKRERAPKALFLVIPGNPGLPGYYRSFLKALYSCLNRQYPIWVVGHAGHCKVPHGMKMIEETDVNKLDDGFGLRGQIEHKLSFIRKNVPKDVKLVLIGHSIGAYMIIEMLKRARDVEIIRGLLLFPTVERIAESPQGKIMTPVLSWFRYPLYILSYLVWILPDRIKHFLLRLVSSTLLHADESALAATIDFLTVNCVANAMYMGHQEMNEVTERDNTAIRKHLKKLTFYYGSEDRWCPRQYYEEMKRDFPNGDIRLCEKGFRHAFVLDSSEEMAADLADWMRDDLARL